MNSLILLINSLNSLGLVRAARFSMLENFAVKISNFFALLRFLQNFEYAALNLDACLL